MADLFRDRILGLVILMMLSRMRKRSREVYEALVKKAINPDFALTAEEILTIKKYGVVISDAGILNDEYVVEIIKRAEQTNGGLDGVLDQFENVLYKIKA